MNIDLLGYNTLEELVEKLKDYHKRVYLLDPRELSEMLVIKSNLLRYGILVNDELLSNEVNDIVEIILQAIEKKEKEKELMKSVVEQDIEKAKQEVREAIAESNSANKKHKEEINKMREERIKKVHQYLVEEPEEENEEDEEEIVSEKAKTYDETLEDIEEKLAQQEYEKFTEREKEIIKRLISVDTSVFDDDRSIIRNYLFDKSIRVVINRKGKSFTIKQSVKGDKFDIIIPSTWEIVISDSLLLKLYDERFNKDKLSFEEIVEEGKKKQQDEEELKLLNKKEVFNDDRIINVSTVTDDDSLNVPELDPLEEFVLTSIYDKKPYHHLRATVTTFFKKKPDSQYYSFYNKEVLSAKEATSIIMEIILKFLKENIITEKQLKESGIGRITVNKILKRLAEDKNN